MADVTLEGHRIRKGPGWPRALRRRRWSGAGRFGLRAAALLYVGALVVLPLGVVVSRAFRPGLASFAAALADPGTRHALELSVEVAAAAVVVNAVFGIGTALLLARARFPGKRLLGALVDVPVSVSPIVVGLALILVYGARGWLAAPLRAVGLQVIDAMPGMILATAFVSLPLMVRAVAPVLVEEGTDPEHAAASLGADALARFRRITLPAIRSAAVYGLVLTVARCLGEYGAVLVVSGNIAGQTETATIRIDNLYQVDLRPDDAYALTFLLLLVAIAAIVAVTLLRRRAES